MGLNFMAKAKIGESMDFFAKIQLTLVISTSLISNNR